MSKKLFLSAVAALATTGALLSTPVLAAEVTNIKQAYDAVEQSSVYKEADIKRISGIFSTKDGYKVMAHTADDKRVHLMVNGTDSTISLQEKRRHRDRHGEHHHGRDRNN